VSEIKSKKIEILCAGSREIPLENFKEFQGELKSLSVEDYEKLKNEIINTGMAFPIRVWTDENNVENIIGGHQTIRVLRQLKSEGYDIPLLPVSDIKAKNIYEAKRRVMQDASQYGQISRQGLYEFMIDSNLDMGDLASSFKLPDINIPSFGAEFFMDNVTGKISGISEEESEKEVIGVKEYSSEDFSEFRHKCPRCGFAFD
jgi:hypothetical protein